MSNKLVLVCIFFLSLLPVQINAQTYQTVFVNGVAPMTIDGDFSDWAFVQPNALNLSTQIPSRSVDMSRYKGENDLSANMKAFVDVNHLYLAIDVTDDHLVFERDTFGEMWWDDAVQIYFENGGWMDITRNILGDVVIEGNIVVNGKSMRVPYLWEAIGGKAGLRERDGGYQVEVQIPRTVVTEQVFQVKSTFSLNVLVGDHDQAGRRDNMMGWIDKELGSQIGADGQITLGSELIFPSVEQFKDVSPGFWHPNSKPIVSSGAYLPHIIREQDDQFVVTLQDAPNSQQVFTLSFLQATNFGQLSDQFNRVMSLAPQSSAAMAAGGTLASFAVQSGQFAQGMMVFEQLEKYTTNTYTEKWIVNQKNGIIRGLSKLQDRIPNTQQFIGELSRLRDYAGKTSDFNLRLRVLEVMAEYYVDNGDLTSARPYMQEAIRSANSLIQTGNYDHNMRNAIEKRMVYRLKLKEDAIGTQEMMQALSTFKQPKQISEIKDAWAVAYRRDSRFEDAITRHQQLRDSAPDEYGRALAKQGIGDTYFVMKHYDKAIDHHKQVLDEFMIVQEDVDVRYTLIKSHLRLAEIYDRRREDGHKMGYLKRSISLYPPTPNEATRIK